MFAIEVVIVLAVASGWMASNSAPVAARAQPLGDLIHQQIESNSSLHVQEVVVKILDKLRNPELYGSHDVLMSLGGRYARLWRTYHHLGGEKDPDDDSKAMESPTSEWLPCIHNM